MAFLNDNIITGSQKSIWHNKDYLLLWGGKTTSSFGRQVSQLALPLIILAITGSPALAGFISGLALVPYVLLSLPAGVFVDRWNRKRLMIICDIGRAICLGSVPIAIWLGRLTIIQLCLVTLIEGIFFVFFDIAEASCLPKVVSPEQLSAAASAMGGSDAAAGTLGPALSGVLLSIGRAVPYLVDSITYVVSVISLLFIQNEFQEKRETKTQSIWFEVRQGLLWLWKHPVIRLLAVLSGVGNCIDIGVQLFLIVVATQLHASLFVIGMLEAGVGVGGILGSFVAGYVQKHFQIGQILIITQAIAVLLLLSYLLPLNVLLLGIITSCLMLVEFVNGIVGYSYRLALIPDEFQGRVNSVFRLMAYGMPIVGWAGTGVLLQTFHIIPTVLIFTSGSILLLILTCINKHVRNEGRFNQLNPQ